MSTTLAANAKEISTDLFYRLPALLAILLGCFATAMAQANRSVYTSLEEKQCRVVKVANADEDDQEVRCRGTAGYTLVISEGDLRQNITVITPKRTKHSLDLWDVVSGGFSNVGTKAEWRLAAENNKPRPVALIFRFDASEDVEHPDKKTSYLVVAKITATEICVTDKISPGPKANEDARHAADAATGKPCLKQRN